VLRSVMMLITAAILLMSAYAQPLNITGEKSYLDAVLVRDADLIVVGTLRPMISYPWLGGIHIGGTIAVGEVLYGSPPANNLTLRLVTPWSGPVNFDVRAWISNPRWYPVDFEQPCIWFLKRVGDGTWRPSAMFGFDALSHRADYEDYIRRYKR